MKTILLSLSLALLGFAQAQVTFSIEAPASISGVRAFTSNDGATWGLTSLIGISVIDTVKLANDGVTAGTNAQGNPNSACGCFPLPAGSMTGKVAMIYRYDGSAAAPLNCGFGLKALTAQNAGARAIIIVNRESGVVGMNGGTEGPSVTIPVVMVDIATGILMKQKLDANETVVVLIGDKTGLYENDLSLQKKRSLRTEFGTIPAALVANTGDLSIPLGAWVFNSGNLPQTGVKLITKVLRNAATLLLDTSSIASIPSGDSLYFTSPTTILALNNYPVGEYNIKYSVVSNNIEQYVGDNSIDLEFYVSPNTYSQARLKPNGKILKTANYAPNPLPTSFGSCTAFKDANASRMGVLGAEFAGLVTNLADSLLELTSQEVTFSAFLWDDVFTTGLTFDLLNPIGEGIYTYTANNKDSTIYIPLAQSFRLLDNQQYLFCISTPNNKFFQPFDDQVFYDENDFVNTEIVPRNPLVLNGSNYGNGRGFGLASSTGIRMDVSAGINETPKEASVMVAYPNPAVEEITVSISAAGKAIVSIKDLSGHLVSTQNVEIINGKFITNVKDLSTGTYVFNVALENGKINTFKVMVTK